MSTRKEERERLRQERLAAQQAASSSEKRRLYLGYAVAGVIVAAIVAGIVVAIAGSGNDSSDGGSSSDYPELAYVQPLIGAVPDGLEPDGREGTPPPPLAEGDLEKATRVAGCDLQLNLPEEGNTHFTNVDKDVDYKTNPPTSGDHFFAPTETGSGALADGAFLNTPPLTRVVHSMEHGRVLIHYSPDLSEAEQLEIKGVFEESPQGVQMFPNPDMPYDVAITAWTQLAGCRNYTPETLDVLRDFRDIYRGNGPENVPLAVSG
jgi:Protein of unknown function (DUF3105)